MSIARAEDLNSYLRHGSLWGRRDDMNISALNIYNSISDGYDKKRNTCDDYNMT